jgi:hypothetical protein
MAEIHSQRTRRMGRVVEQVSKPIVAIAAALAAVFAVVKRRRGQADAALWREATSDSSR